MGSRELHQLQELQELQLLREAGGLPSPCAGRVATRGEPRGGRGDEGLRARGPVERGERVGRLSDPLATPTPLAPNPWRPPRAWRDPETSGAAGT